MSNNNLKAMLNKELESVKADETLLNKFPERRKYAVSDMQAVTAILIAIVITAGGFFGYSVRVSKNTDNREVKEVIEIYGTRIMYHKFESLINADLIVIGEFTERAEEFFEYSYDDYFEKDIVRGAESFNQLRVTHVLKGDIRVGEVVTVAQAYAYEAERGVLITFSGLTPMHKGDRWIYFLEYDENTQAYKSSGDSCGRFPVPTEQILQVVEELRLGLDAIEKWLSNKTPIKENEEYTDGGWYVSDRSGNYYRVSQEEAIKFDSFLTKAGEAAVGIDRSVYGRLAPDSFNYVIYSEILDYFNIEAQDWVNPGKDFDERLIELVEEQSLITKTG
jgi:hypothetical protein